MNPISVLLIIGAIGAAFLAGVYWNDKVAWAERGERVWYASTPEGCEKIEMYYSGWTLHLNYRGGIGNGGASGMIQYECRKWPR